MPRKSARKLLVKNSKNSHMMDEATLKEEIALFKEYFSGQEGLLKSIRSLLIGLDVPDEEKKRIQAVFSSKPLLEAFRHRIYQLETDDVPLGQVNDLWMGLDARLQGASIDAITQAIKVRTRVIRLFEKIESYLQDPFQEKLDLRVSLAQLENSFNLSESACDLMARNMYIKSVDMVLAIVQNITQKKEESPEEVLARVRKDSTK